MSSRRRFIETLIGLSAAPAIVRADWIMPIVDRNYMNWRTMTRTGQVRFFPGDPVPEWLFLPVRRLPESVIGRSQFVQQVIVLNDGDNYRVEPTTHGTLIEWRGYHHITFKGQSPPTATRQAPVSMHVLQPPPDFSQFTRGL